MSEIKIGNKKIKNDSKCIISFEIGATFQNVDNAKKMIDVIASSNADAVKFQTIFPGETDRLMGKKDIEVNFTTSTGDKTGSVYDALKTRELSYESWTELVQYVHNQGLIFITSPEFLESVDLIEKMNVDAIKIAKGDINNGFLIEKASKTGIPIILDGRERFEDVQKAIKICEQNKNFDIIIMHCPSGYPAKHAGIHLKAINEIQNRTKYPVGFSDHSPGDIMNFAAIALGVKMIEKTITTDRKIEAVEHLMSLELNELTNFVINIRNVENALGNSEILDQTRVDESSRRCLVAKENIQKNMIITQELLDFKRPGNLGISVSEGFKVLSKKASQDISKGEFLQWSMIKEK